MKNLKLFFFLTVLIYCANLFSQESIMFDKQYLFDNQGSYIRDVKQTSDSGYICAGGIGFSMYDERYLLFKTDSLGELEWYKYNNTPAIHNNLWAVDITNTGNYIGIGTTMDNPDWHESGAIVMYDSNGDTLWTKQYAFKHPSIEDLSSMIAFLDGFYTSDNSIVAAGVIKDDNQGSDPNPIVVKTNIEGDTLWTWRLFNADNTIVIESIVETKEGDYIAVGRADMPIIDQDKTYAPQRGFIVKLSPNGELIYLKEWTDIEFNYFTDVAINQNGELVISGVYFQHPPDFPDDSYHALLVKTDANGETVFYKQIMYGKNCVGEGVAITKNNDIALMIMFGAPEDSDGVWGFEVLLQYYSYLGDLTWEKSIGGVNITNWPYALISTSDNGFVFCGLYGLSGINNFSWLIKVDSLGNGNYSQGWINYVKPERFSEEVYLYPNPCNKTLNIYLPLEFDTNQITISNISGQVIFEQHCSNNFINIDVSELQDGLYNVKIINRRMNCCKKLVIKH
jgi:hypothetical protein